MVRSLNIVATDQSDDESENSSSSAGSIAKEASGHSITNGNEATPTAVIRKTNRGDAGRLRLKVSRNKKPFYKEDSSEEEEDSKTRKSKPKRKRTIIQCSDTTESSSSQSTEGESPGASKEDNDSSEAAKSIKTNGRKRKILSSDEDIQKPKRKRKARVKKLNKTTEEGESPSKSKNSRRKAIRHVLKSDQLNEETKDAEKQEEERRKRLENLKDGKIVEVDVEESIDTAIPVPITKRLVLQKKPLVEVHPDITVHLKPHQVEGIQFIWDNLIETTVEASKESGGGCILAHCMGLGKTLQTIAVTHTILYSEHLNLKTVLVVAPLNTLLNWIDELNRWSPEEQPLTLYNLNEYSTPRSRIEVLKKWTKTGGVMVMGYDMFRLLASGCRIRYKAWKEALAKLLLNPGPDLIVCDEGHKLKNSESNISVVMSKIETARRLVLTGTPLQNNLMEYQCMVNFVKPSLLGSVKEFRNRFVNPIQNGQHSDSTHQDVRLMKKRCHILHNMLQGFVQRKDYTALAKYLCEKLEYIIKVRLTPLQNQLYRHYLDTQTNRGANQHAIIQGARDTGLFADYQNLMRVWTHPRVLQLHSIRQEHMNQFVCDESSDEAAFESSEEEKEWKSEDEAKQTENNNSQSNSVEDSDEESTASSTSREEEEEEEADDSDDSLSSLEEVRPKNHQRRRRRGRGRYGLRGGDDGSDAETRQQDAEAEAQREANKLENNSWYSSILKEHAPEIDNPSAGGKLAALFEILRLAQEFDDKVLVFSQSLLSLDLIEEMLALSTMNAVSLEEGSIDASPSVDQDTPSDSTPTNPNNSPVCQKWYKNIDYFRMDGSSLSKSRQKWINEFNDESDRRARLFLISTKAGSLGVNLVAANRVVIFDASWNPTHDIQSIFRVYRFGQTKSCFIYRLIAQGTMEEKIYDRQVTKQSLSFRVVDEQQINRHFTAHDLQELYTFSPSVPHPEDKRPALPKDKLLAELLVGPHTKHLISSYHTHDSLLDHQEEEELTEEERKAAWEEYENEKKGIRPAPMANSAMASKLQFQQLAFKQQFIQQQQQHRLQEQEKFKKVAAQLQARNSKFHVAAPNEAQSVFVLVLKAMEFVQKTEKKVKDLQPLDFPEAVSNLRKLPMYEAMKEDSLKMLAVELKIRRQQLRLTAEKEHRQAKMQMEWLSNRYSQLVQSSAAANVNPSVMTLPPEPSSSFLNPSNLTMMQQQAAASAGIKGMESSSTLARTMFADMIKSEGLGGVPSYSRTKDAAEPSNSKPEEVPIVIDSDSEQSSPGHLLKVDEVAKDSGRNRQVYIVNFEDPASKSTSQDLNKASTSAALPATTFKSNLQNAPLEETTSQPTGSNRKSPVLSDKLKTERSKTQVDKSSSKTKRKASKKSSEDEEEEYYDDTSEEEDWEALYLKNAKLRSRRTR